MIRVDVMDSAFNRAFWAAKRTMPVETLETPRQYGQRWREEFKCRVDSNSPKNTTYYIFDNDEDYTWFMLKFS